MNAQGFGIGDQAREASAMFRFGLGFLRCSLQHVTGVKLIFVTLQTQKDSFVTFGATLRRLMDEKGINASQLGRAASLSHVAIRNYLLGRKPNSEALERLADVFEVSLDELLRGQTPLDQFEDGTEKQEFPSRKSTMLQPVGKQPQGLQPAGLQPSGLQPPGLGARRTSRQEALEELESANLLQGATPEFQRVAALKQAGNYTWEQVGKELDLSVAMLMMVKTGKRKMSMRSLYRLGDAEKRVGIDSYETLSPIQLRERPTDTNTGTMADYLRTDELPRYIVKLKEDIEDAEKIIAIEQEQVDFLRDHLRRAEEALAQKQAQQKNLPVDAASNITSSSQQEMENLISTQLEDIALARQEAEDAKAAAAEAMETAEQFKAQNEHFERQIEEQLAKQEADRLEMASALANKAELEAQIEAYIARFESEEANTAQATKTPLAKKAVGLDLKVMGKEVRRRRASRAATKGK